MSDLKELIEREMSAFLEWPTADKSHVTTTSAKLFAEHVAQLYADHVADSGTMAAPAVQGEPDHARIRQRFDEIEREICEGKHTASSVFTQMRAAALRTVPQPAEQKPIGHDWDDQDKCRRCGDRDWYAGPVCTPKQPEEQQPDVTQLVEALEQCVTSMIDSGYRADAVVVQAARAALAPYRKGGE